MTDTERCFQLLLDAKTEVTVIWLMNAAKIAPLARSVVCSALFDSAMMVIQPNGTICHTWSNCERALVAAADNEIRVLHWATQRGTISPLSFVAHIMERLDILKLHTRRFGHVRAQTPLNLYNAVDLKSCVERAGVAGVSRTDILGEYSDAFLDLFAMCKRSELFGTNDRVWHV